MNPYENLNEVQREEIEEFVREIFTIVILSKKQNKLMVS
jgi:hypothetical protein